MKIFLSTDNLRLLAFISQHQILTTRQIIEHFVEPTFARLNPPERKKLIDKVNRRLRDLTGTSTRSPRHNLHRYLTRVRATSNDEFRRPLSAWYVSQTNHNAIARDIDKDEAKADYWHELISDAYTTGRAQNFTSTQVAHETGISDIFLSLSSECERADARLAFALRTSPTHSVFTDQIFIEEERESRATGKVRVFENSYPMNPDAITGIYNHAGKLNICFWEFDNRSEGIAKITKKHKGYELYRDHKRFTMPRMIGDENLSQAAWLNARYNLGIPEEALATVGFRVFYVAKGATARNRIFYATLDLPKKAFYFVTSLEEFEKDPFGDIWLIKGNCDITVAHKKAISMARSSRKSNLIADLIQSVPRQAFPLGQKPR